MQNINNSVRLKEAIEILEVEQVFKGVALKEQFRHTFESLKPANLILGAFKDIASSPNVIDNILGTSVGLVTGFLSKKIFIGTSGNLFRKLLGSFMQFGVSNFVSNHPDAIKTFGQFIMGQVLRKKREE
jgi:hypothetical protein